MDLGQLFTYLMQQSEAEEQKRREAIAQRLNGLAFRNHSGPNTGNPIYQGDAGIYSDSMPFSIEDYFRTQKPGFYRYINKDPRISPEVNIKPKNPYQGLML